MPGGMPSARTLRITEAACGLAAFEEGVAAAARKSLRQRDRRNAEDRALERRGDRARIGHVFGDVLAPIDAG